MARTQLMTWNAKQKRWFVKFRKRQYAVSVKVLRQSYPNLVGSETEAGSCTAANQWWREKLSTLEQHPHNAQLVEGIEIRQQLASWCQLEHQDELRATILGEVDQLRQAQQRGTPLRQVEVLDNGQQLPGSAPRTHTVWRLGDLPVNPLLEPLYLDELLNVWQERHQEVSKHRLWQGGKKGFTLSQAIELFLTTKESEASPARVANLRLYLEHFKTWRCSEALEFTSVELLKYRAELTDQVKADTKSSETIRSEMIGVKQFIDWCFINELIDTIPRNLRNRSLRITVPEGKKQVWTEEQIQTALKATSGEMRLFVLLGLNCGMYSSDISALRQDDVDWEEGRITWTRVKSKVTNQLSYKLWPETFELLKAHRTDHPILVLTTRNGTALKRSTQGNNHKEKRHDAIGLRWRRFKASKKLDLPDLKSLRKTSRNLLKLHPEYGQYAITFQQQSYRNVDGQYYFIPSQTQFDAALAWLRTKIIR
jgi:integrase